MKTVKWVCSNCGYEGGQLEEPRIWKGHLVCLTCERKLQAGQVPSTAKSSVQAVWTESTEASHPPIVHERTGAQRPHHGGSGHAASFKVIVIGIVGVLLLALGWTMYRQRAERNRTLAVAAQKQADHEQANARVRELLGYASQLLEGGHIDGARLRIEQALSVEHATDLSAAHDLKKRVAEITDPQTIRAQMIDLSDAEFEDLRTAGHTPTARCARK